MGAIGDQVAGVGWRVYGVLATLNHGAGVHLPLRVLRDAVVDAAEE